MAARARRMLLGRTMVAVWAGAVEDGAVESEE